MSDGSGFSRSALIKQLDSSAGKGFTYAQAVYAAGKVGLPPEKSALGSPRCEARAPGKEPGFPL